MAACLGAELVPERPYDTIRWGLVLKPFRPLELFFFFNVDPEFGSDLRVFYARKSLAVPTEDAYVFAWDYIALLARYGKGAYPLTMPSAPSRHRWVALAELDARFGKLYAAVYAPGTAGRSDSGSARRWRPSPFCG